VSDRRRIVILGLSITSSWGNGHATTYRGLVRELGARGHDVLFLERDVPWYADNRDLDGEPENGRVALYASVRELEDRFLGAISGADAVIVGSYVPDGVQVGDLVLRAARGVRAFYDIDTPVTLAKLARGEHDYLAPRQVPGYDLYLSFTGGPTLARIERELGSPRARALYCSVDPARYHPEPGVKPTWDLGYMGTYGPDRQAMLDRLLVEPARRAPELWAVVVGPQYPDSIRWPANVDRIDHLAPPEHRAFYNAQRYTVNVTRADMVRAGWSPSVRLFEAAACGTPIISDPWPGLAELLDPGEEILVTDRSEDVERFLREIPESDRRAIGERARRRILAEHTAAHRAEELEAHLREATSGRPRSAA
jgi:spore maturation protein CgeB